MSAATTNGAPQNTPDTATTTALSLPPTAAATAAAVSKAPASPTSVQSLQPLAAKPPSFTPQTQLTGAAAIAAKRLKDATQKMTEEKPNEEQPSSSNSITPTPAAQLFQGYPTSKLGDAPPQSNSTAAPEKKLAALPSIATAANAMDTSGSSPTTTAGSATTNGSAAESGTPATAGPNSNTTDPALLQPQDNAPHYQPIAAQQAPRTNSIPDALSATTPTTPGFSATTPTTPFSPTALTPGGGRGKHTCPHCQQTFTRHHNLKSHLLTHSHEKPFLCQQCQSRFRRLHDLKRHSKLHTGERPHMCNKCGRKFARGDALARHARAEGGCAGRRGSMAGSINEDGSLVGGFDDNDGMEGLEGLIDGDPDGDVDMMDSGSTGGGGGGNSNADASARRRSLPSIRTDFPQNAAAPATAGTTPGTGYPHSHTHHTTYPPLNTPNRTASTAGPSPSSSLFAPPASHLKPNAPSIAQSATPVSGNPAGAGTGSILSPHGVITDSPRSSSPNPTGQTPTASASTDRAPASAFNNYNLDALRAASQSHGQAAPTASMNSGSSATNMFSGLEPLWDYVRRLEARLESQAVQIQEQNVKNAQLEARVAELEARGGEQPQEGTSPKLPPPQPSPQMQMQQVAKAAS